MSTKVALTKEEMQKRVGKIEALTAKGHGVEAACKKAGYPYSNYYLWKRRIAGLPDYGTKPKVIEYAVESPKKTAKKQHAAFKAMPLVMVSGTPAQLAEFYRQLG